MFNLFFFLFRLCYPSHNMTSSEWSHPTPRVSPQTRPLNIYNPKPRPHYLYSFIHLCTRSIQSAISTPPVFFHMFFTIQVQTTWNLPFTFLPHIFLPPRPYYKYFPCHVHSISFPQLRTKPHVFHNPHLSTCILPFTSTSHITFIHVHTPYIPHLPLHPIYSPSMSTPIFSTFMSTPHIFPHSCQQHI